MLIVKRKAAGTFGIVWGFVVRIMISEKICIQYCEMDRPRTDPQNPKL